MIARIAAAHKQYVQAAQALVVAVEEEIPIGSVIEVNLGRSLVRGEVKSAGGCWWYDPAKVVIENVDTGKIRKFSATDDSCAMVLIEKAGAR